MKILVSFYMLSLKTQVEETVWHNQEEDGRHKNELSWKKR
jgi:hypothetical protein